MDPTDTWMMMYEEGKAIAEAMGLPEDEGDDVEWVEDPDCPPNSVYFMRRSQYERWHTATR